MCFQGVSSKWELSRPYRPNGKDGHSKCQRGAELVNGKSAATQPVVTSKPATLVKARQLADAPDVAPRKGRSKITNGKKFIGGIDQRNPWVRRV